jgi:hypothetical protein
MKGHTPGDLAKDRRNGERPRSRRGNRSEEYTLVSEGSVAGVRGAGFRVRVEVRYWPSPSSGPRTRILKWEEKGL